jgi:hypothetical protein
LDTFDIIASYDRDTRDQLLPWSFEKPSQNVEKYGERTTVCEHMTQVVLKQSKVDAGLKACSVCCKMHHSWPIFPVNPRT